MANKYKRIRSMMEAPLMDDRKWAKVPSISADAFLVDLEDSATPSKKVEARQRLVELIKDPKYLGDRVLLPRVNNLDTEWGRDDLVALAQARAEVVVYPKVRSRGELRLARHILNENGCDPDLMVVAESAEGILGLPEILAERNVVGVIFGPSDLALDTGFELMDGEQMSDLSLAFARSVITMSAAANDIATFDIPFVGDIRNLDQVRASVRRSVRQGFSGMVTFYPPHVPVINEGFEVSDEEIAEAKVIVKLYRDAIAQGQTAVIHDGRALIVQDYKRATALLIRAGE